jgi:L-asparagine transporter-like permease
VETFFRFTTPSVEVPTIETLLVSLTDLVFEQRSVNPAMSSLYFPTPESFIGTFSNRALIHIMFVLLPCFTPQAVCFVCFLVGFITVLCIGNYFRAKRAQERQRQRRLAKLAAANGGQYDPNYSGTYEAPMPTDEGGMGVPA